MADLRSPDAAARPIRYRWPWYLLVALVLGVTIGVWAMYREARRIQRFRQDGGMQQPGLRWQTNDFKAVPDKP